MIDGFNPPLVTNWLISMTVQLSCSICGCVAGQLMSHCFSSSPRHLLFNVQHGWLAVISFNIVWLWTDLQHHSDLLPLALVSRDILINTTELKKNKFKWFSLDYIKTHHQLFTHFPEKEHIVIFPDLIYILNILFCSSVWSSALALISLCHITTINLHIDWIREFNLKL